MLTNDDNLACEIAEELSDDNTQRQNIEKEILEEVKQYIWLKCKQVFDPPGSTAVKAAFDERVKELEWTLREVAEVGY